MNKAEKRGLKNLERGQGAGPKRRVWVSYESMGGERLYIEVPASRALYGTTTAPVLASAQVHETEPKRSARRVTLPSEIGVVIRDE